MESYQERELRESCELTDDEMDTYDLAAAACLFLIAFRALVFGSLSFDLSSTNIAALSDDMSYLFSLIILKAVTDIQQRS